MKLTIKEIKGKYSFKKTKQAIRDYIKEKGYNIPEDIIKDLIRNMNKQHPKFIEDIKKQHIDWLGQDIKKWDEPIVLNIGFSDLTKDTQDQLMERGFGSIPVAHVPKDAERMKYQLDTIVGDGKNEPVFFTEYGEGYELQEGWHRTMALFSRLPKDKDGKPIGNILINAIVGHYK